MNIYFFFKSLTRSWFDFLRKNPQAVLAVVFLTVMSMMIPYGLKAMLIPRGLLILANLLAMRYCGRFAALLFFISGLFALIDFHLVSIYQDVFANIAIPILELAYQTDTHEVFNYCGFIRGIDFGAGGIIIIFTCLLCFNKQKKRGKLLFFIPWLLLSVFLWFGFGKSFLEFAKLMDLSRHTFGQRLNFKFYSAPLPERVQAPNVVLIIGETGRGCIFKSLFQDSRFGGELNSACHEGAAVFFDDVCTQNYLTIGSFEHILSRKLTHDTGAIFKEPSLFKFFRETGVHTRMIARHTVLTVNGVSYTFICSESDDMKSALNDRFNSYSDSAMLPLLQEHLDDYPGSFTVVKMECAHFPYSAPAGFDTFKPADNWSGDVEKIMNSYKNAQTYVLYFLNEAFKIIQQNKTPTVLVYIPDHGMSAYESSDEGVFLPVHGQFHILMIVAGNKAYLEAYPGIFKNLKSHCKKPLSNAHIFDTVVGLARLTYPDSRPWMDLTQDKVRIDSERFVRHMNHIHVYEKLPNVPDTVRFPLFKTPYPCSSLPESSK